METERASADLLASALIREKLDEQLPWPTKVVTLTGRRVIDWSQYDAAQVWPQLLAHSSLSDELRAELQESAAHLGKGTAHQLWAESTFGWLREAEPSFSPLVFFEQMIRTGHALHPMARIRHGMTPTEVRAYAPEWSPQVNLALVAVKIGRLRDRGMTALLAREHVSVIQRAQAQLRAKGFAPEDYGILPVHPWQAEHILPGLFGRELADNIVIPLSQHIPSRPLLSLRTLAPIAPASSHLKTAIGVRLTGAVRGVSPEAAANGPAISTLLSRIMEREKHFEGRLRLLGETASASFIETQDESRAAMLGALARENPEINLSSEFVLPVASLRAISPATGKTVLTELVDKPEPFAWRYARLVMPPLLTLLTRYGVALEPHGQNTLIAVNANAPTQLLVRDFGAIRIRQERLHQHGLKLALVDGSAPIAPNDDDLRNRLSYSLIHDHLGELLPALAQLGNTDEPQLWQPFLAVARNTFATLRECCASCERNADDDEKFWFAPTSPLKAHLRARLQGATHQAQYVPAPNPFSLAPYAPISGAGPDATLEYLRAQRPDLVAEYADELPHARDFTLERLSAACTREQLDPGTGQWAELLLDAENSAQNLALARVNIRTKPHRYISDASGRNVSGEQFSVHGHNLHPISRARSGFSPQDNLAYPAEGQGHVALELVAVRSELLKHTRTTDGTTVGGLLTAELNLHREIQSTFDELDLRHSDYEILPIHPWQLAHALPASYPDELASKAIVPLNISVPAIPGAALRTLATAPGVNGRRLMVKTAIAAQVTTTVRNISPASTINGPGLSRLLETILRGEPALVDRVAALVELAGACFRTDDEPNDAAPALMQRERNLSVIIREDLSRHLRTGEEALTACLFYAQNPQSGTRFLSELVQQRAKMDSLSTSKAALSIFDEYAGLLIPTMLTLLTRYGIGLEAHLQNTIAVVEQGRIVRLLLRDFAGVRIHRERLEDAGVKFTPAPGSITLTDDMHEVYRKTFHAGILANLAEVVHILSDSVPAKILWQRLRTHIDDAFLTMANSSVDISRRLTRDRAALLGPHLEQKAFLRMRLFEPDNSEFATYWPVANPLPS